MSSQSDTHTNSFARILQPHQEPNEDQSNSGEQRCRVNNGNGEGPAWSYNVVINTNKTISQTITKTAENSEAPLLQPTTHSARHYDPHEFGNLIKPTSFRSTVIHLIIISAGPPILSIPSSLLQVGYAVGLVSIFLSTSLYAYSMRTLLWSEYEICKLKRIPHLSYRDLIYIAFQEGPPKLRWFSRVGTCMIDVVFVVFWSSACCYNLTMAAENIHIVCDRRGYENANVHQVMAYMFAPVLFLCWVPKLKHLVPVSMIANIANVLCLGVVIYDVIFGAASFAGASAVGSITHLPFFLGTVFFALNATGLMLPLKKEMNEPKRFNSAFGVLTSTYFLVFLMYALFGPLCVLKYGSNVKETVTQNVQQSPSLTEYMILANALALILQYPLFTFVIFDVVRNNLIKGNSNLSNVYGDCLLKTTITVIIFLLIYFLPSVKLFLTFGGAVGTMIDSLLLPAFVQIAITWRVSKTRKTLYRCLCKSTTISILAVALMVSGGATCIQDTLRYYNPEHTQASKM